MAFVDIVKAMIPAQSTVTSLVRSFELLGQVVQKACLNIAAATGLEAVWYRMLTPVLPRKLA